MNATPQHAQAITPEGIFGALNAFQLSSALAGAIELDLFTAIDEGATDAAALANRCHASERGCRILCDYLTIHRLLTKSEGRWGLTPETALFLSQKSPAYLGSAARFLHSPEMMAMFKDVAAVVRKGGTVHSDEGTVSEENPVWVEFARSMPPIVAGAALEVAGLLGGTEASPKVLDIAAGHGLFGIEIAKTNPNAHVVALDWAAVLEVAKENAAAAGVAGRYSTLPGNAFDADFGKDYDIVLLANFIHHFDKDTCVRLLRKVYACLQPGGRAATIEFIPNDDRITPPVQAAFSLTMLASTRAGDAYTFAQLESMFAEAGFASSELHDLQRSPERLVISKR